MPRLRRIVQLRLCFVCEQAHTKKVSSSCMAHKRAKSEVTFAAKNRESSNLTSFFVIRSELEDELFISQSDRAVVLQKNLFTVCQFLTVDIGMICGLVVPDIESVILTSNDRMLT